MSGAPVWVLLLLFFSAMGGVFCIVALLIGGIGYVRSPEPDLLEQITRKRKARAQ